MYLAVVGAQNVDVIVLTKQGKVSYKVTIDLLLEAISQDLTIVNTKWLPGAHSSLAVATREFIKIYDLAEDTMSPTHNIMIFNGFITDFAFSSYRPTQGDLVETTLYGASKAGSVYYQDITYRLSSFGRKQSEEEKMSCDNSDLMMTEAVSFLPSLGVRENQSECHSIHCVAESDLLVMSFSEGVLLIGRKDRNSDEFRGFSAKVHEDPSFAGNNLKAIW